MKVKAKRMVCWPVLAGEKLSRAKGLFGHGKHTFAIILPETVKREVMGWGYNLLSFRVI